jgi:Tfp pilus assembly protein PilF
MSSNLKSYGRELIFCLGFSLLINTQSYALDKKTSFGLSHYIMAVMYERLDEVDQAIAEYKKVLKVDSKNSVIHLSLALSYIKKNEFDKAVKELKLIAQFDPQAVQPHAILALIYSTQNKPKEASQEYEIALQNASKLQPKNIEIYKSLGAIYLQQKKLQEAQNTFLLILDLSPVDAEAHFYLANIYDELKNRPKAKEELKKALEVKSDFHEALNYLGYIYVEENKNLDQAEKMIKKALELEPNSGAYIDSLGWLYFKQGKLQEAIQQLEKATALLKDPVIFDHLGDVYFKLGDLEKAKMGWQSSLVLDAKQDKVKEKIESLSKKLPNPK